MAVKRHYPCISNGIELKNIKGVKEVSVNWYFIWLKISKKS